MKDDQKIIGTKPIAIPDISYLYVAAAISSTICTIQP